MKTSFSNAKQGPVQAVRRALDLVEILAKVKRDVGLIELSREAGLNKSTAYQLLATLQADGFVEKDKETRYYRLGPKILEIAVSFLGTSDLIAVADPLLREIRDRTGETTTLWLLAGDHRVIAAKAESFHPVRWSANLGEVASLVKGAGGKAILAFLGAQRIRSMITHEVKNGGVKKASIASLLRELSEIRARSFSITKGEHASGGFGIFVPLFGPAGEIIGSLGFSGPVERRTHFLQGKGLEMLREAGNRLSHLDCRTKSKASLTSGLAAAKGELRRDRPDGGNRLKTENEHGIRGG